MKTFAFIFARGGSKGLPGKNIMLLDGKPLIAYSIELAKSIKEIDKVYVSTEDEDIARIGEEFGAEVIVRPTELAQDESPEWLAWQHAINYLKKRGDSFDCFVSLPATAPLRNKEDVLACLNIFDDSVDIVITVNETNKSPYFNMVLEKDNYTYLLKNSTNRYARRQDVPKTYEIATVAYITGPEFIINNNNIFDGRVKSILIPRERAVDIDDSVDFKLAEILVKEVSRNVK